MKTNQELIRIPLIYWDNREGGFKNLTRLFNPAHIVSVEPHEPGIPSGGIIYTVDGRNHTVPAEAYHEAFVAIENAFKL